MADDTAEARMRQIRDRAPHLLRYIVRLGNTWHDAEDIAQETLLRAWRHIEELDVDTATPWLYTVARRISIDRVRARALRKTLSLDDRVEPPSTDGGIPGVLDRLMIAMAVAPLRPEQKQPLGLMACGLEIAEIAEMLGIPVGTVKSRMHYGRKALKAGMGNG